MTRDGDIDRIAHALGGARRDGTGWRCRCPVHDGQDSNLSLHPGETASLVVTCWSRGCDRADILAELRRRGLLDDGRGHDRRQDRPTPRLRPAPPQAIDDSWRSIWRETVEDGPHQVYLLNRLGRLPGDLADLRYHPRCPRGRDRLPAMVALMRDAVTNEPTGIHRTFIMPDGSGKADVEPAKMMLGRAAGSVVKLTPDEDVTLGLGLSEGIEDGLAIINSDWRPIWACLSAGAMASFPVLHGIECLTAFSDNDSPGRKAAAAVVERWCLAGKEAVVAEPPYGVKDFGELNA